MGNEIETEEIGETEEKVVERIRNVGITNTTGRGKNRGLFC